MYYKSLSVIFGYAWVILGLQAHAMNELDVMPGQEVQTTKIFTIHIHDLTQGIKNQSGEVAKTITLCSDPSQLTQEYMINKYPVLQEVFKAHLDNINSLSVINWKVGISFAPEELRRGELPPYAVRLACNYGCEVESYEIAFKHQESTKDHFLTLMLLGELEISRQVNGIIIKETYKDIPLFQKSTKATVKEVEECDVTLRSINNFAVSSQGNVTLQWNAWIYDDPSADDFEEELSVESATFMQLSDEISGGELTSSDDEEEMLASFIG